MTTLVKLCGLRDEGDVRAAVAAGADQLGIVFVPGARRRVASDVAARMVDAARATGRGLEVVAVVGDLAPAQVEALLAATGIDVVQLVGAEEACRAIADALPGISVIRTIGVPAGADPDALRREADAWVGRGARVVYDAVAVGALGGTGERVPRELLDPLLRDGRFGLAGGLDPSNVAAVVRAFAPSVVDVSSGIETDGRKDPARMRAFVAAARGGTA